MRFDVSHTIEGIDLAAYERLYFDEAFNEALCAAVGLGRRLIGRTDVGGTVHREVEISPDRQLPGPVAKALGAREFTYVEALTYAWGSGAGTWVTRSSVMAERISSDGSLLFSSDGTGVVRRVQGHVTVKIFGLGGMIERAIVADVERSYAQAATFTQAYLRERP